MPRKHGSKLHNTIERPRKGRQKRQKDAKLTPLVPSPLQERTLMNNDDFIKLLNQDEYLTDPMTDKRVSTLEAPYELCLAYVQTFLAVPEMTRVIYDRVVDKREIDSSSPEAFLSDAIDASAALARKSEKFASTTAYASEWLMTKPLMKVLMQRLVAESPVVNSIP